MTSFSPVNLARRNLVWCALLALLCAPVCAVPVLIGEFALQGTLNNNVSGGPSLVSLGGQLTSSGYVVQLPNQGLTFTSVTLSSGSYSIELSFKSNLDTPAAWSKLIDVSNLASDYGLYIHNSSGLRLQFYPQADGSQPDFIAGTNFDVVLTRSSAGTVAGYVNGQPRFSFNDSSGQALFSAADTLSFFVDDTATGQREVSTGTVNFIRIFNDALSASEVGALFAAGAPGAIPEPAACAAMFGAAAFGLTWWRRRRGGRA